MNTKQRVGLIVVVLLLLMLVMLAQTSGDAQRPQSSMLSQLVTSRDTPGQWQQARPGVALAFPADHLAHPAFAVEWWYFTANLKTADLGQHLGVQFTLFRRGLDTAAAANPWQQPQLYMAHMAVTDSHGQQHHSAQRFSREGPGLAGSSAQPLALWLDDWRLQAATPEQLFPAVVAAQDHSQGVGYQLQLTPLKPRVLQGEQGFSTKGMDGGASHYYSYTRLGVHGTVQLNGRTVAVAGEGWFDHEWTSTTLVRGQQGWDWFALQLADGRDITLFRLRGANDPWQLAIVDAEGKRLAVKSMPNMRVQAWWQTEEGIRYPIRWQLTLSQPPLALDISASLADQEMRHIVRYWEGAVQVTGSHQGVGYMELTGYDRDG